ncbi:MAG: hypothetical protein IKL05_06705 [Clostridia bacterium]|nr:hypothetical protein [Clostridia bacterium]
MKSLLEDLWFSYQLEKMGDQSEKRKALLCDLIERQRELSAQMNDLQKKLFEEYGELYGMLNCETEKDSFVEGVRFAISFILEAI